MDTSLNPHPLLKKVQSVSLILIDGECVFCNHWAMWILDRDRKKRFVIGSLQSAEGKAILQALNPSFPAHSLDTVVLLDNQTVYTHSTAILKILGHLGGWYRLASLFLAIPRPLRDAAYRFIARHRHRLMGQKGDSCRIIPPELKKRTLPFFLDS